MMCPECKGDYKHNSRLLSHMLCRVTDRYQMDKKEKDKLLRRLNLGNDLIKVKHAYAYCWHDWYDVCNPPRDEDVDDHKEKILLINEAITLSVRLAIKASYRSELNYTNPIKELITRVAQTPERASYKDSVKDSLNWYLKRMLRMEKREGLKNA